MAMAMNAMTDILDHHFDRRHGKGLPDGAPHVQHDHLGKHPGPRKPALGAAARFVNGVNTHS